MISAGTQHSIPGSSALLHVGDVRPLSGRLLQQDASVLHDLHQYAVQGPSSGKSPRNDYIVSVNADALPTSMTLCDFWDEVACRCDGYL